MSIVSKPRSLVFELRAVSRPPAPRPIDQSQFHVAALHAVYESTSDEHILVPRLPQLGHASRFQASFDRCAILLTDFESSGLVSDEKRPANALICSLFSRHRSINSNRRLGIKDATFLQGNKTSAHPGRVINAPSGS